MRHSRLAPVLALICCTQLLPAQTPASPLRITAITFQRQNIYDASENTSWLTGLANRLHKRTNETVIRNELLFRVGDTYDSALVAETERNLWGLDVFREIQMDTVRSDSGMAIRVVTKDGWSTNLDFRFRSTGGSIAYTAAAIESNLFGTAAKAQFYYRKEPDRITEQFVFQKQRLIAGKVGAYLAYSSRSDGEAFGASLSQPFFSTKSLSAGSAQFDTRRERILIFRDGGAVAVDTAQRRYVLGRVSAFRALEAERGRYLRAGVFAQVRRDDFASQAVYDITGGIPGRTVTAAFGGVLESSHDHYLKVRGFKSFGRQENISLSRVIRGSLMLAPKVLGYERDGIAPGIALQRGFELTSGFLLTEALASGLFTSEGLDSGRVQLSATMALLPEPRHQVVLHAEAGWLHNPLPGTEFDLGFGVGPRGYREHSFTGDRQYFVTAEYRYVLAPQLFKTLAIGVAAFADHGGASWHDHPMRSGTDIGVGLRLGSSRSIDQESRRIDLVRRLATDRQPAGWVLVIGTGFVFGTR